MKKTILGCLVSSILIFSACEKPSGGPESAGNDYPIQPVNFWEVKVTDEFWAPRMETNRLVTVPYLFRMNEETGRVDNFRIAAGLKQGKHTGKRYNDSDVYKAIELSLIHI